MLFSGSLAFVSTMGTADFGNSNDRSNFGDAQFASPGYPWPARDTFWVSGEVLLPAGVRVELHATDVIACNRRYSDADRDHFRAEDKGREAY